MARRFSPHRPIFDPEIERGTIRTGSQVGSVPAFASVATITLPVSIPTPDVVALSLNPFPSTQATGAGTSQITLGYPTGIADGDVVVVACRKQWTFGTLPSGFTEEASDTDGLGNRISVVTGVYNAATHGANFNVVSTGGTSSTRAILWSMTGVTTAVNGFSANTVNGNDQFFPTITTPAGGSIGFCFGVGGAAMTDEQPNGWTDDWPDATSTADDAYSKIITSSGAQTMPRWDNIGNVHQCSFYMVPA